MLAQARQIPYAQQETERHKPTTSTRACGARLTCWGGSPSARGACRAAARPRDAGAPPDTHTIVTLLGILQQMQQ